MKRILILVSLVSLLAGCATTGPVKGVAAGNVIYTDASREMAFDASCEALRKLGYTIEMKDEDNFFAKGSYFNPLTGYSPLYGQIDVIQETSGVKIEYGVDQPGTIKELDITGYYSRCANNIYKEIEKILSAKGCKVQKR